MTLIVGRDKTQTNHRSCQSSLFPRHYCTYTNTLLHKI